MSNPRYNQYVANFDTAIEAWADERFVSKQELRDLTMFSLYLVNLAEDDGWTYDGHSLNIGIPMSRLVVRGTLDGVPHVVFTSGRTTTACIRIFMRKLAENMLEWTPDRFRT